MKSLVHFIKGIATPLPDQVQALEELEAFFQTSKSCFILKGYAGTGKTTLTKWLVDYLQTEGYSVNLMAPTGRAARILQQKTGHKASTIHRGIYNLSEVEEIQTHAGGRESYKFRYRLNQTLANTRSMVIVDEASMISDRYSEDDFFVFGSGRLLTDLMSYMALTNQGRTNKLIFIGDEAQLPPVGDSVSGALSKSYLIKEFGIDPEEYQLTEVVRQNVDSGILDNATYLRNQQKAERRNSFKLDFTKPDALHIQPTDLVDRYLLQNPSEAVVINHSNKSALEFNQKIRAALFPGVKELVAGDILIINQNNYNYTVELPNGLLVKVKRVDPQLEVRAGMKAYNQNGESCEVTHKFRRVTLSTPAPNGEVEVDCLVLEDFLYSEKPKLSYEENVALYIDFKMRNPHLKVKSKEFKDALRQDSYFNALRAKFGYSITCHKAQGGEWDSAFVNLDHNQSKLSLEFLCWTYTAITRAKKSLYLFNVPVLSQFTNLNYGRRLLGMPQPAAVIDLELPEDFDQKLKTHGLNEAPDFKKDKFIEVFGRLSGENLEIIQRISHPYQETYVIADGDKRVGVTFWYNGQNKFTKFDQAPNLSNKSLFERIKSLLESPISFRIIGKEELKDKENGFDSDDKFAGYEGLKTLFLEFQGCLKNFNCKIEKVEHLDFKERHTIVRSKERAVIDFTYNNKHSFTYATPVLKDCNSDTLLIDIEKSIEELKTLS